MLKRNVTTLLIGLTYLSSVSEFTTVICRGYDGHIAVEPILHDHCEQRETVQTGTLERFVGAMIGSSNDHGHCEDSLETSHVIIPARKNVGLSTHRALAASSFPKLMSAYATFGPPAAPSHESSSFFEPLRTVILLA